MIYSVFTKPQLWFHKLER